MATTAKVQATGEAAAGVDLEAVRQKVRQIKADLGAVYREREGTIDCIVLAALTHQHALLIGPPGTGKSALFYGFLASFIDARVLEKLVTKYGTIDEFFGPVMLSALRQDRYERATKGLLADVECAFLDEVFKGSSAVLNALLQAMNERIFDGKAIPLKMVVGASNELPADDELAAVLDRFLLRDVVSYVAGDATWMSMMSSPPAYKPRVFLTLAEWDAAFQAAAAVTLPERVVKELLRLRKELATAKGGGVVASDRRWIQLTGVLRAAAWLDGESEVTLDQLHVLRFGLWQKPADIAPIKVVLASVERSDVGKAVDIIDAALRVFASRTTDPSRRRDELPKVLEAIEAAAKNVKNLLKDGVGRRAKERISPSMMELQTAAATIKSEMRAAYEL